MSYPSVPIDNEAVQKLLVGLQNDFKTLAQDTKKKYPLIKEVWFAPIISSLQYTMLRFKLIKFYIWFPGCG